MASIPQENLQFGGPLEGESSNLGAKASFSSSCGSLLGSNENKSVVGPYLMGGTLGVGTFGKVKLAVHQVTGQKVAIKIINKSKMEAMDMHEKIRREISILQCLHHPHVIRTYELIDTPSDIFMVMEYVEGGELFDYIVQRARLSENDSRRFFQQIVSGVEHCHQHMICHRDLKPENILLDENLNVKVGDFGLSNFTRDGEFLKTSCGSPNYASPEVVSGKAYAGPEVDVWSIGVILYALLCGALPFDDEHVPNLFKKIKQGNFTIPGHLSAGSRHLILRMLVVDPAKRISLKAVRSHPWFQINLPTYLRYPLTLPPLLQRPDQSIVAQMKKLGYAVDEDTICTHTPVGTLPSSETVAYQLLADRRAKQATGIICVSTPELPSVFPYEVQKRVQGYCCCELIEPGGISIPPLHSQLAACDIVGVESDKKDNPGKPTDLSKPPAGVISPESQETGMISPGTSQAWAASRWKLGVEAAFDAPILITAILNTLKACDYEWVLLSPYKVRCRPLRSLIDPTNDQKDSLNIESNTIISSVTPSDSGDQPIDTDSIQDDESKSVNNSPGIACPEDITLTIQLYKIGTCRYIIDVEAFDGSVMACLSEALWITSAVYSALTQLQRQQMKNTPNSNNLQNSRMGNGDTPGSTTISVAAPTWSPTTPVVLSSLAPSHRIFG